MEGLANVQVLNVRQEKKRIFPSYLNLCRILQDVNPSIK